MTDQQNKLVIFQDQKIRRLWHDDEWFYSVVDIVAVLSESPYPRQYWDKVKQREFTDLQLSPIWLQLKAGKARKATEKEIGGSVISHGNYLPLKKSFKKLNE